MRLLYGIKPTGVHLGHILTVFEYIRNRKYTKLGIADENVYGMVGDLHKLSASLDIKSNERNIKSIIDVMCAVNSQYFLQSSVSKFYYYAFYYLSALAKVNQLEKIYKINYSNNTFNSLAKLYYPVLMALDIIMMQPCYVLVGIDQIHNVRYIKSMIHLLNRNLSCDNLIDVRFEMIEQKIFSISLGNVKMSTSNMDDVALYLDLDDDYIRKVIMKAITQSVMPKTRTDCEPSTLNLFNIYAILNKISVDEAIALFADSDFCSFKEQLFNSIISLYKFYRSICILDKNKNVLDKVNQIHQINFNLIESALVTD